MSRDIWKEVIILRKNTSRLKPTILKLFIPVFPHDLLKEKLKCFVEEIAVKKDKKFVIPKRKNAYFSNKKNNNGFSIKQLIECLHFVIENSYVLFQEKSVQTSGGEYQWAPIVHPHLATYIPPTCMRNNLLKSLNDKGERKSVRFS